MSGDRYREEAPLLPEWAVRLLEYLLPEPHRWTVPGDFAEVFSDRALTKGYVHAWGGYAIQVLASLPAFFLTSLIFEGSMLRNYWAVAVRNLSKHKGYTFINISGLAVGIACCLLILLYVRDELQYDRHHAHADRIMRVHWHEAYDMTPTAVAPVLERSFPEVEVATLVYDQGTWRPAVVAYEDQAFQESGFFFADSSVFDVFTFPFVAGNPRTALNRPKTIVLTASTARKYFGDTDPLGRVLRIDAATDFEVTGVIEDLPTTSHIQFDLLASFSTLGWSKSESWGESNFWTYVRLDNRAAREPLQTKLETLLDQVSQEHAGITNAHHFELYPLTEIYLYYQGRITYVYLFAAIALLILLVACVNYMNLATARAARRAREVGLRKVLGAHRRQLIKQFFGESALTTGMALVFGIGLAYWVLPLFRAVSGKTLDLVLIGEGGVLVLLVLLGIGVTVIAGSYPALVLSAFRPVQVLKGTLKTQQGNWMRHGLVVFQFTVSVFLLVGTAVVYNQLHYMQTTNLGFDQEQVVVLPIGDRELRTGYTFLKDELLEHPSIRHAAAVHAVPGRMRSGYWAEAEGIVLPEGERLVFNGVRADKDVVEAMGMTLLAGPGFPKSDSYSTEQGFVYLLNETAVQTLGWTAEDAVGKRFSVLGKRGAGEVVGVVQDFHHESLHTTIEPLTFFIQPGSYQHLLVKMAPERVRETMAHIEQVWQKRAPHRPFTYQFLDQEVEALYRSEQQMSQLFTAFAGLAIVIACLGLFGLVAFAAEQRTKEIGVRKVLGATVPQLVMLLSRDFARLVFIAYIIAVPLAYLSMNRWLADFAYRIDIHWSLFLYAGLLAVTIAGLTVSYQALKAALADPVRSLRYE